LSGAALDHITGRMVVCKAEALQRTGSFKFRGAYNAVASLSATSRQRGVAGASSGNHAQALALAGQLLGVPVTVVVPRDAPAAKVNGARSRRIGIEPLSRHALILPSRINPRQLSMCRVLCGTGPRPLLKAGTGADRGPGLPAAVTACPLHPALDCRHAGRERGRVPCGENRPGGRGEQRECDVLLAVDAPEHHPAGVP
jgi:hypothetical protein